MSRNESKGGATPLLVRHGWKEHSVPGTSLVPVVFPVLPRTSSSRVYAVRSSWHRSGLPGGCGRSS